jgi:hypothetical protein
MSGRILGLVVLLAGQVFSGPGAPQASIRGRLVQREGRAPALKTAEGKLIALAGERESLAVLGDARLAPYEIELSGKFQTPERFAVGPFIESRSILVHKDGKTYTVSYWCPVCSIRSYTPGKCVCCQEETHLDLQEVRER